MELDAAFRVFPMLKTDRLVLRRIGTEDIESIYRLYSNEQMMAGHYLLPMAEREEAWHMTLAFEREYEEGRSLRWGIMLQDQKDLAGIISLTHFDPVGNSARIALELDPAYWHVGYGYEALRHLLSYAFEQLIINRMEALVPLENLAALALLKKTGFTREGLLREYFFRGHRPVDVYIYSLLRREFLSTAG